MTRDRHDSRTPDLLDWELAPVAVAYREPEIRAATIAGRYCRAMKLALERCGLSRTEVAERMSEYLGEEVSENMLNRYLSEAAETHTINIIRFEALIEATGQYELLAVLPQRFGMAVVPVRYLDLIDAVMLDEKASELVERSALKRRQFKAGGSR